MSKKLIPDKWKIKNACSGVCNSTAIYFDVVTHENNESEVMVMLSKDEFEQMQKETRFWERQKIINRIKQLTIQQKFKIVEATEIYPHWLEDAIDSKWEQEVSKKITLEELENIIAS